MTPVTVAAHPCATTGDAPLGRCPNPRSFSRRSFSHYLFIQQHRRAGTHLPDVARRDPRCPSTQANAPGSTWPARGPPDTTRYRWRRESLDVLTRDSEEASGSLRTLGTLCTWGNDNSCARRRARQTGGISEVESTLNGRPEGRVRHVGGIDGRSFRAPTPSTQAAPLETGAPLSLGSAYAIPLVCRALRRGRPLLGSRVGVLGTSGSLSFMANEQVVRQSWWTHDTFWL